MYGMQDAVLCPENEQGEEGREKDSSGLSGFLCDDRERVLDYS
jgi:hypothetical protein